MITVIILIINDWALQHYKIDILAFYAASNCKQICSTNQKEQHSFLWVIKKIIMSNALPRFTENISENRLPVNKS